jgi:hypothetical protein
MDSYQYPSLYAGPAIRHSERAAIHQTRYKSIIEAFKQTQARIESGELATAAAAQAELLDKLSAASSDAVKARAALPRARAKER